MPHSGVFLPLRRGWVRVTSYPVGLVISLHRFVSGAGFSPRLVQVSAAQYGPGAVRDVGWKEQQGAAVSQQNRPRQRGGEHYLMVPSGVGTPARCRPSPAVCGALRGEERRERGWEGFFPDEKLHRG